MGEVDGEEPPAEGLVEAQRNRILNVFMFCSISVEHFQSYFLNTLLYYSVGRSEGFSERDIWFLGTLDQGSTRCPEFLGNHRRLRRRRRRRTATPDPPQGIPTVPYGH